MIFDQNSVEFMTSSPALCHYDVINCIMPRPLFGISQTTFRHRRVRFSAFLGQPLSKQLYTVISTRQGRDLS